MLLYQLPDRRIEIRQVVLDFNGTIAMDGQLIPGVEERLLQLASHVPLYILTADTFGSAAEACSHLPVKLTKIDPRAGGPDKERIVRALGAEYTAAVGNGVNDIEMLACAALGLLVLGSEGASPRALLQADAVFVHINDALDFLLKPKRLVATLRP